MLDVQAALKTYASPTLNSRTREQATLFLMGYAWQGDEAANDLLLALFSDACSGQRRVPPHAPKRKKKKREPS
jgi:hypothetical protein